MPRHRSDPHHNDHDTLPVAPPGRLLTLPMRSPSNARRHQGRATRPMSLFQHDSQEKAAGSDMQRQRQLEEVREEEQLIKAWAGSMEEAAASLLGARLKEAAATTDAGAKEEDLDFEELELDCTCHTAAWCDRVATSEDLKRLAASIDLPLLHQPREGYPLLVLDFDRTLIDGTPIDPPMVVRPHVESFLMEMHAHYELAIWSKTDSDWLSAKLDLLGMSAHPQFHFCLALDRSMMLTCNAQTTDKATGQPVVRPHLVKPLQLIWSRFAWWGRANTLLVDDKPLSYALNRTNGVLIRPFRRDAPGAREDEELVHLARYLKRLAHRRREVMAHGGELDMAGMDHTGWRESVVG